MDQDYEFSSIFKDHPSEERLFDHTTGSEEEKGLMRWMKQEILDQLPDDWDGIVSIGTYPINELKRKGVFPHIQIHPAPSNWEGEATCMDNHNIEIHLISTIRAGDLSFSYFKATSYAQDLYDLFKSKPPETDYASFSETPLNGRIELDYREGNNKNLSFSLLELNYRLNLSTEAKNES